MIKKLVISLIKIYQIIISPNLVFLAGTHGCKFEPTCSEYTVRTIKSDGVIMGLKKGFTQLSKCY